MSIQPGQYEDLIFQVIRDTFPSLRLYSDVQLLRKITQVKLTDVSLELFSFILESSDGQLTKNELLALASRCLYCLKKYVEATGTPFTLKTFIDHISLLDVAVDECFPGYSSNKLLRYTILPLAVSY